MSQHHNRQIEEDKQDHRHKSDTRPVERAMEQIHEQKCLNRGHAGPYQVCRRVTEEIGLCRGKEQKSQYSRQTIGGSRPAPAGVRGPADRPGGPGIRDQRQDSVNRQTGGAECESIPPPATEIGEYFGSVDVSEKTVASVLMIWEQLERGVNRVWQKRIGDKPDQRQEENRRHQKQTSATALFEPYLRPKQKHHAYSGVRGRDKVGADRYCQTNRETNNCCLMAPYRPYTVR